MENNYSIPIAFLEQFFDKSNEAVLIIDKDGNIVYCNPYSENIFEIPINEIKGSNVSEFFIKYIPQDNQDYLNDKFIAGLYQNLFNTTHNYDNKAITEYKFHFANGNVKDIYAIFYPIKSDEGNYIGVLLREDRSNRLLRLNLEYRKNFEKLLSKIAEDFTNLEVYELDDKITNALKKFCQFANADGAILYVVKDFKVVPEYIYLINTLQVNKSILKEKYENIHQWIYSLFKNNSYISDDFLLESGATSPYVRKYMKILGLSNILMIPVRYENDLLGCLAIFNAMLDSDWREEDAALLRTFCDILISGIDRVNKEILLENEIKANQTIATISNYVIDENDLNKIIQFIVYSISTLLGNQFAFLSIKDLDQRLDLIYHSSLIFPDNIIPQIDEFILNNFQKENIYYENLNEPFHCNFDECTLTVENYLYSPIYIENSNFGYLFIANKDTKFNEENSKLVSRIINILSIAINRHIFQKKLQESEEKYYTLLENASDAIFIMKDHKFIYVNSKYCELTGYSREELLSPAFDYFNIIDDDSKKIARQRALDAIEGKRVTNNFEMKIIRKDGEIVPVAVNTILLNEPCNFHYFLGIVRDITTEKQYQKIISRRDEILEVISQAAEQFLIDTNWKDKIKVSLDKFLDITDASVVYLFQKINENDNQFVAKCLNYSAYEKFTGELWYNNSKECLFDFENLPELKEKLYTGEVFVVHSDDEFIQNSGWLEKLKFTSLTFIPIIPYNEFWGFFLIRNVETRHNWIPQEIDAFKIAAKIFAAAIINEQNEQTLKALNNELEDRVRLRTAELEDALDELRRAKEELHAAYLREKEFSELRARFLNMISQEYRSPLTVVLTSLFLMELAVVRNDLGSLSKHIDRVRIAARQMTHLLDNVLVTGQLSEQQVLDETHFSPFSLKNLIETLVSDIKAIDQYHHNFHLTFDIQNDMIISDENLFRIILNNLLNNAVQYSPQETDVKISVGLLEDNMIYIQVKDYGFGIPEKDREHLFEPFYRGKNTEGTQGTGLGLHIVKTAVEKLGGKIDYTSEIGVGTSFTVTIPVLFVHV